MRIDLNCDMGESFGAYHLGQDAGVMPYITSANIACGYHAGDPLVMDATVRLAQQYGVSVGAHPGHPDLQGFGRRALDVTPDEVEAMILYQIAALAGFARVHKIELAHVKPHGALYHQVSRERALAAAAARAVARFSKSLIMVAFAGSLAIEESLAAGLRVANEAFPDRGYNLDGSLIARRLPGAVLETSAQVMENALKLAREGIPTANGVIPVDTLCLHGDHPHAAESARQVRSALEAAGMRVTSL